MENENMGNTMNQNEKDFLLFYMEQTWEEMRHLENLRERVSVLILTIASIIAGFVVQQKFAPETELMIWFIIVLGVVGVFMGLKIFQIHQMGQKRLNKWNDYLVTQCGESPKILELKREADLENKKEFKLVSKIPHNFFWTTIYGFIIIIGIIMLTMIKDATIITNNSNYTVESPLETTKKEVLKKEIDTTLKVK
jgi:heme/copper-type cytochrome/quinol oxidase subunit 4